jgi:tetratricopeptide (TPR) repeat protein
MENPFGKVIDFFIRGRHETLDAIEECKKQEIEPYIWSIVESLKLATEAEANYEESYEYKISFDLYDKALETLKTALKKADREQEKLILELFLLIIEGRKETSIGDMNIDLGNFSASTELLNSSKMRFEKAKTVLNKIKPETFKKLDIDFDAFSEFLEGLKLYTHGLSIFTHGMSLSIKEDFEGAIENYKKAIDNFRESFSIFKKLDNDLFASEISNSEVTSNSRIDFLKSVKNKKWLKIDDVEIKFKNFFFISGIDEDNYDEIIKRFNQIGDVEFVKPSPMVSPRYMEEFSYYKIKLGTITIQTLLIDKIKDLNFSVELSIFRTGVCIISYSAGISAGLTPEEVKKLRLLHSDYIPNFDVKFGNEKFANTDFYNLSKVIQKRVKELFSNFQGLAFGEPSYNFTLVDIKKVNKIYESMKKLIEENVEINSLLVPVVQTELGVEWQKEMMFITEPIEIREDTIIQVYPNFVVVIRPFVGEWSTNKYIDFIEFIYAESAFLSSTNIFLGEKLERTRKYLLSIKEIIVSKKISVMDVQQELLSLYELEINTFKMLEALQKLKETTGYENKVFINKVFELLELNSLVDTMESRLESLKSASSLLNDVINQHLDSEMTEASMASERAITIFELVMFGSIGLTFISTVIGVTQFEFSMPIVVIA